MRGKAYNVSVGWTKRFLGMLSSQALDMLRKYTEMRFKLLSKSSFH